MNAEKTGTWIINQVHQSGYSDIFLKPLISLRVSAYIGGSMIEYFINNHQEHCISRICNCQDWA